MSRAAARWRTGKTSATLTSQCGQGGDGDEHAGDEVERQHDGLGDGLGGVLVVDDRGEGVAEAAERDGADDDGEGECGRGAGRDVGAEGGPADAEQHGGDAEGGDDGGEGSAGDDGGGAGPGWPGGA